jgi:GTPase SAR1 family protein
LLKLTAVHVIYIYTGTKVDLREDKEIVYELQKKGHSPIKREQAHKMAHKIRAYKYVECSALTQKGLKQVSIVKSFF